ncbi:hypothetical protein CEXT_304891 [Caerostris extrusa]|uniref:Uncharacterized protein n=1 Tax=Caerostris extrusa TaxID=172846 RepID=A0AAV4QLG4_CAEEX|nr:hypothetical protein CEXT_304891 [Caerostris extrusa]
MNDSISSSSVDGTLVSDLNRHSSIRVPKEQKMLFWSYFRYQWKVVAGIVLPFSVDTGSTLDWDTGKFFDLLSVFAHFVRFRVCQYLDGCVLKSDRQWVNKERNRMCR